MAPLINTQEATLISISYRERMTGIQSASSAWEADDWVAVASHRVRPWDGEPTPLLALARGHRWLAMLESGKVKSLRELARKEGVDSSYVSRMVNLTTLAPDIVAVILDETLPPEATLFEIAVDPPALWEEQRQRIGNSS